MLFEQKFNFELKENNEADVIIKCKDADLYTHRIVLAALSRWFRRIFKMSDTDEECLTILLKDFSSLDVLPILDFIYGRCGTLENCSVIKDLYLDLFDQSINQSPHPKCEPKQEINGNGKNLNTICTKINDNENAAKELINNGFYNDNLDDDDQFMEDFFQDEVKLEPEISIPILDNKHESPTKKRKSKVKNIENFDFLKEGFRLEELKCHICNLKFIDEKSYRRHVYNVHAPGKTFKCEKCDYVATKDAGKLRIHMAKKHGIGDMLKCDICEYETPVAKYLIKHKKMMHQGNIYQCDQCNHKTSHKQLLQQHIKVKHEGFKLSCDQCLYTTGDAGALKKHRLNKHEGVVYPCDQCSYVANAANNLSRHKRVKHQEAEFLCDRCDYKTGDKGCLKEHQQIKHEGLLFRCEECDYSTKARSSLRVHKETVHLGITHPCQDCEYVAKTKKDLRYHRARKHNEAAYKCDQCDYGVAALSLLNQHIMFKHEGKKMYCNLCPYFATSQQAVNKHKMKKHSSFE